MKLALITNKMKSKKKSTKSCSFLKVLWSITCIIATISTVTWQISNYLNGRDSTVVEYKKFNGEDIDVYPSIGMCFSLAVDEKKLSQYGIDGVSYSEFLAGSPKTNENETLDKLLEIDYDDVSLDLEDIILRYGVVTNVYEEIVLYQKNNYTDGNALQSAPGLKDRSIFTIKCFSIDIPYEKNQKLIKAYVAINSSIFPSGIRPASSGNPLIENAFTVAPHYQKQFYRHINMGQINWPARNKNSSKSYTMEFDIRSVEVLQHRNKYKEPCGEGISDFDAEITKWVMDKTGCKPSYWNAVASSLPPCTTWEQYNISGTLAFSAVFGALDMVEYDRQYPCRSLEKIQYDSQDVDVPSNGDQSIVSVAFNFKEFTYKEIKSVRSMDLQALIGNIFLKSIPYHYDGVSILG